MSPRTGFSLAEVIVAMTLLSIGTLAVAGTGLISARAFTRAEVQERVLREVESVLDSLVALSSNSAGMRESAGSHYSWSAADSSGVVVIRVTIAGRPPFEISAHR